jgi:hypothetical protein
LLGTNLDDLALGVAVDRGNPDAIYIVGNTIQTTGAGLPGSNGGVGGASDAFLARYARNGTRVWVRQFGTGSDDRCLGAAVYQTEIFATGSTTGLMAGTANAGNTDIFIARFSAQGIVLRMAQLGSTRADHGQSVAVDSSGVYVTGWAGGSINGQPYIDNNDAFVARYSHTLVLNWTRTLGTSSEDLGYSIALDFRSNVLITGRTSGAPGGQTNAGATDVMVASFTSGGELQWTRLFGTSVGDMGQSIAVDTGTGTAYVAGQTFGPMNGEANFGNWDLVLLKLQVACAAGLTGDGVTCTEIDECAIGTHNCSPNATCANLPGAAFFACTCRAGFTGSGVVCAPVSDATGTLQWARQAGSASQDMEGRVAVDNAGRVFVVGHVRGAADGFDTYLIAYNSSTGTALWSQTLGSNGDDQSLGVAADHAGSLYVTGQTTSLSLDGQANAGGTDVFLARFVSSSGAMVWTRVLGTASADYGQGVAVDLGNPDAVYVGGYTLNATGGGLPGSAGGFGGPTDAFVARYARNGTRLWVRQFGTSGEDRCLGVAVYQAEVYVTGETTGIMAGSANAGGTDIFIARFSAQGVVSAMAQHGSSGPDNGWGIAVNSAGVFLCGWVSGNLSGSPPAGGGRELFVGRFTHAGALVWTSLLRNVSNAYSIALDHGSNALVTGYTRVAPVGQTGAGGNDVFVARFTSSGVLQWTRLYGTPSTDAGWSIAVDGSSGTAYVAGNTGGSMYGQPYLGSTDLFVLKLQVACAAGLTGDGFTCTNIDECAIGTHNCSTNASCTDLPGTSLFACTCRAGFTGSGVACAPVNDATGMLQWARQAGSAGQDTEGRVAVDQEGRVFLVGHVTDAADGFIFAGGPYDVLVTAFNGSTGAKLWSRTLGSSDSDVTFGVAADGAGSVYVTGYTSSSSLDGQANAGSWDQFLTRYVGSSGVKLWTRLLGTTGDDYGYCIAVDSADNVYVGGYTTSTGVGGLPGSAGGLGGIYDAHVARYASNGTRVWVRQFGSNASDLCLGVAVYQSEIFATGSTTGAMAAGNASAGGAKESTFIVKMTALGAVAWTAQLGTGVVENVGKGIAVDSSGVYVTGYAAGSLNGQVYAGGIYDIFLARYSHSGTWTWTRMLGTGASDVGSAVVLAGSGSKEVLITGFTEGALQGQTNAGGADAFVASFTSDGALRWVWLFGSGLYDSGNSAAIDGSGGAAYVAGSTRGSIFGQPSLGGQDLFVLKLKTS